MSEITLLPHSHIFISGLKWPTVVDNPDIAGESQWMH